MCSEPPKEEEFPKLIGLYSPVRKFKAQNIDFICVKWKYYLSSVTDFKSRMIEFKTLVNLCCTVGGV